MADYFTSESLPQAVENLFILNNYEVRRSVYLNGAEIDLIAKKKGDPFAQDIYIEVTVEYVNNVKYGKDLTKFSVARTKDPGCECLIISSSGFTGPVEERAKEARIKTLTYDQLFESFEKFHTYAEFITNPNEIGKKLSHLDSIYEEPHFEDSHGTDLATAYLEKWGRENNDSAKWLMIVGEYGTGKTALTEILQYRWLKKYQLDPKWPIPIRIELRDFTRQFDSRGLLHHFLDKNRLGHIPIAFLEEMIRLGRAILLLDGYDEMAQYLHTRERRTCLETLANLSANGAKGIVTTRPNYLSEAEELQIFEVLYSSFDEQSSLAKLKTEEIIRQEREVDELLQNYYLNRFERRLQDLSPQQTEALVKRILHDDTEGCQVILGILAKVFRSKNEGQAISLSGKPVIITYLLEIVEQLKSDRSSYKNIQLSEWQIYQLIIDQLMARDFARAQYVMPDKRRTFLRSLAVFLSSKNHAMVDESNFKSLIRSEFKKELKRVPSEDREQAVENYFADLRSSATLTRINDKAKFGWHFSHNSLREYLVTEMIIALCENGKLSTKEVPISDPMRTFVASLENIQLSKLLRKMASLWTERHSGNGVSLLFNLLWDGIVKIAIEEGKSIRDLLESYTGENLKFDDVKLTRIEFSTKSKPMDFSGANFNNSEMSYVGFGYSDSRSADFSNCILESVNFSNARLEKASFVGAWLVDVDFLNTTFTGANFKNLEKESSIFISAKDDDNTRIRIEGFDAIGYLAYHGGVTDKIPDYYRLQYHPKFSIIEKISRKLAEQDYRQRLGLEQKGAAQQDPKFAREFLNTCIKNEFVQLNPRYNVLIGATPKGRRFFNALCERKSMCPEIADFLDQRI